MFKRLIGSTKKFLRTLYVQIGLSTKTFLRATKKINIVKKKQNKNSCIPAHRHNGWVFANSPGGRGSIAGQVIPKIKKIVLDSCLLNTQDYNVWIKGKWSNPVKRVVPFSTPRCISCYEGTFWVALDYTHTHTHTHIYIYIYNCRYIKVRWRCLDSRK